MEGHDVLEFSVVSSCKAPFDTPITDCVPVDFHDLILPVIRLDALFAIGMEEIK